MERIGDNYVGKEINMFELMLLDNRICMTPEQARNFAKLINDIMNHPVITRVIDVLKEKYDV